MDELTEKRGRLQTFLDQHNLDAIYLSQVANFAWLTAGLEPVVMLNSDRAEAGLLVTRSKDYVICNSIEYPRLRDEDHLEELGYEFRVTPWYNGVPRFDDLVKDLRWASDWPLLDAPDLSMEFSRLRFQLTPQEVKRYRWVGYHTGQAIERAARAVRPGMSEGQIAGLIAAQALDQGITPVLLLVGVDERIHRYRHPIPTQKQLKRYAMLVICGRRWGLVASATRFVYFGSLPAELEQKQKACAYVDATFNAATTVGSQISDIFQRAIVAYDQVGFPGEWQKHNQGGAAGYLTREYDGTPTCDEIVLADQGFAWNPSITGIKSEDTMIVNDTGCEFITVTGDWPSLHVELGDRTWERPVILTMS
ncbi:MAG TPA: M24 family metallopeptidase [Anaerolineales bacterium]|nr:M24 family metallopeptidase [Anaerolineales bacterium]